MNLLKANSLSHQSLRESFKIMLVNLCISFLNASKSSYWILFECLIILKLVFFSKAYRFSKYICHVLHSCFCSQESLSLFRTIGFIYCLYKKRNNSIVSVSDKFISTLVSLGNVFRSACVCDFIPVYQMQILVVVVYDVVTLTEVLFFIPKLFLIILST